MAHKHKAVTVFVRQVALRKLRTVRDYTADYNDGLILAPNQPVSRAMMEIAMPGAMMATYGVCRRGCTRAR